MMSIEIGEEYQLMRATLMSTRDINRKCLNKKPATADIPIDSRSIFTHSTINFGLKRQSLGFVQDRLIFTHSTINFGLKRQSLGSMQDHCSYTVKEASSFLYSIQQDALSRRKQYLDLPCKSVHMCFTD